jgi:hypothetical protein
MSHQACFSFRTYGGICAGEQWICDNEQPIARLRHQIVEQPEQNLRYFNSVLKPIELRDLRLRPGSRPLFAGLQLYWKLGPVITSILESVDVSGNGTEALQLIVRSRDPGGVATSRRTVTVTYDAGLDSYVYSVEAHLQIHSPELFDTPQARAAQDGVQFEYSDPWYSDVPAPSVAFDGDWPKRYSHLLAELPDGSAWQMPLNHMATQIPSPQAFAPGGLLVLGYEPGANPAIEFVGDTAKRSSVGVCNWGYDVHLLARYGFDELYRPLCERFRLRLCPDDQVQALMRRASPVPLIEYGGFAELPLYERHTSFAHTLRLDQPAPGDTDSWPWLPAGSGVQWCRDYGRSDSFSLKISKDDSGPAEWTMDREGDGAWTQRWHEATGFRVSVYVRTHRVDGRGALLALRWVEYNTVERSPLVCSQRLVGTHQWTRLEAALPGPPPPDASGICIILRQDGSGTTWFDDLDLNPL